MSRTFHSIAKSTPVPTTLVSAVEEAFAQEGTADGDLGQPSCLPFPLYSRAELQSVQQQDPIIKQFLTYWDTDKKPDAKDWKTETKETVSLLKQWDKIHREEECPRSIKLWFILETISFRSS